MSKSEVDRDGFQTVKSKRFPKNKQTKIPVRGFHLQNEDITVDIDKVLRRIQGTADDLRISNYYKEFIEAVSTVLKDKKVSEVICFGLGHIAECNISRHQLGLLLCIKETINPTKVLVHDPIFYKSECEILKRLGLEVIVENKEGSYVISDNSITLAYFPHCPKQLTNNFLWCNWGVKLHNCLLICNSFNALIDNNPSRIISQSVPYIHKIHSHTKEIELSNNFKYTDIFNDTSLHYFLEEDLQKLDDKFWDKTLKPNYENSEEFITSLMIEKLNI